MKPTNSYEFLKDIDPILLLKRAKYSLTRKRISDFSTIKQLFMNQSGLEVGGPSRIFRDGGVLPLYRNVKHLDGCNFSNNTIWEGAIENGMKYEYYKYCRGTQYILEASDLSPIPDSSYDFVLSSNCLEHVANPMKALKEWIRVVKDGGLLLLALPNKEFCFDHQRPLTEFNHILSDLHNDVSEDDLTHLDEILSLHDLSMDRHAGSLEQFKERSLKNFENRALHQHVFDATVLVEMFTHFHLEVLKVETGSDIIILGRKKAIVQN